MIPKSLTSAYRLYNRKYWDNKLPSSCLIKFKKVMDEKGRKLEGAHVSLWTVEKNKRDELIRHEIWIWDPLRNNFCYALIVLLHEMVHLHLTIKGKPHRGHGKYFKDEVRRLQRLGAYIELL